MRRIAEVIDYAGWCLPYLDILYPIEVCTFYFENGIITHCTDIFHHDFEFELNKHCVIRIQLLGYGMPRPVWMAQSFSYCKPALIQTSHKHLMRTRNDEFLSLLRAEQWVRFQRMSCTVQYRYCMTVRVSRAPDGESKLIYLWQLFRECAYTLFPIVYWAQRHDSTWWLRCLQ